MENTIKDKEPAKGSPQWFNERFDEHLFQLYSVAEDRLDRVEWELRKVAPQLLAALPSPEWVLEPHSIHVSGKCDGSDTLPDMVPDGAVPLLEKFTRLHLTAARCRAIMDDLRPLHWDRRGDDVLNWYDPAVRADFGRRFMEWLPSDEWAREAWERCRLTTDDLLNDLFIFDEQEEQASPQ